MTHIEFEPWIGERFREGGPRLLLVGESHYGDLHPIPALATQYAVEQWRNRAWKPRPRYFLAASRLLNNVAAKQVNEETSLERIAFYNYVQFIMPTLHHRPTKIHFRESEIAFREVIGKVDPTHVLVTGKGVWAAMPHFDIEGISGEFMNLEGQVMEIGRYSTPSGTALTTLIPHLSRGFSPNRWSNSIAAFLAL